MPLCERERLQLQEWRIERDLRQRVEEALRARGDDRDISDLEGTEIVELARRLGVMHLS